MVPAEAAVRADERDFGAPHVADAQIHQCEVADRDVVVTGAHHDRNDERNHRDERHRDRHDAAARRSSANHQPGHRVPPYDPRPWPARRGVRVPSASGSHSWSWPAAILRVAYDFVVLRHLQLGIDSTWYFLEGGVIRQDHAYADPAVFATPGPRPQRGRPRIRRSSRWCGCSLVTRFAPRRSVASSPAARRSRSPGSSAGASPAKGSGSWPPACRDQPAADRGRRVLDVGDAFRAARARDAAVCARRGSHATGMAVDRRRRDRGVGRIDACGGRAAGAVRRAAGRLARMRDSVPRVCRCVCRRSVAGGCRRAMGRAQRPARRRADHRERLVVDGNRGCELPPDLRWRRRSARGTSRAFATSAAGC